MSQFSEFLQQQGTNTTQPQPQTNKFADFIKTSATNTVNTLLPGASGVSAVKKLSNIIPKPIKDQTKKTTENTFRWLGKQLMKPAGVAATETRGLGEAIGSLIAISSPKISADEGVKLAAKKMLEAQKDSWNVLRGEKETSFSKEIAESKGQEKLTGIDKVMGIGSDFILDPLNFVPAVKASKLVKTATASIKSSKPVQKTSEILKAIGQTETGANIRSIFSNKTYNDEFNKTLDKFRNLREYREGELIDQASRLGQEIKQIKKETKIDDINGMITEALENPEFRDTITNPRILKVVEELKTTYKEMLDSAKNVGLKVGEILEYAPHIKLKEDVVNQFGKIIGSKKGFGIGTREFGTAGVEKGRKVEGRISELGDLFEKNPVIQLAKKGQAYAKAITSKQFADEVAKFATETGVAAKNSLVNGLKFEPDVAKVIDNFYEGIKPEELNLVFKTFDKVQNWWKSQALVSPSYHIRNTAGNIWNNFLAGVKPMAYEMATAVQTGLDKTPQLLNYVDEAKKLSVINEGWYAADIAEEVINRIKGMSSVWKGLNPLSRQNYLLKANKKVGTAVENNARLAHYISKRMDGLSPELAAESVKKYLFDYGDLSKFERTVLKRFVPFYTWSRKNIPLQLSNLISQPQKFVVPHKIISEIESGVEQPNEKFMGTYISENIPVRIRTNEDGNTEYFLLGNWLPYAQAIDFLNKPFSNILAMITPLIKTPVEQMTNTSAFFKNTLNQPQKIENYVGEPGEFMGQVETKKNINLLRNIRILNDIDKWIDKKSATDTKDTWMVKMMNTLFGKAATYDVDKSKYFYDRDTDDRISDMKSAIKNTRKKGDNKKADELAEDLQEFIRMRNGE